MFEHVLSSCRIGNVEIKNRFVMPAMGSGHSELDGTVGEESIEYYRARAKGGFGLIITEYCGIDARGMGARNELRIHGDEYIPGFRKLAEAVHGEGGRIFVQLHHGGKWADSRISNYPTVSASPIVWHIRNEPVHELTTEEVYALIEKFGDAALRAKKAGCDGVELHGGHGYLIPQFMSTYVNRRTDEFGGDIQGRARFGLLVIRNIKEKCGADFPVIMRVSGDESTGDGMRLNETRVMCRLMEEAGVDAIHVSGGMPSAYGDAGYSMGTMSAPMGFITHLAEAVKKTVKVPVITVGRITDPCLADTLIADGAADFVALGRSSLADAEFPRKVQEGRTDEIVPCIGCMSRCVTGPDENGISPGASCAFNPFSGNEYRLKIEPAEAPKTVVVVGGGLGGLEAAWVSAARGHKVILLEKEDRLGGQGRAASMPPYKQGFASVIKFYHTMCRKYGVDIRLSTEATAELVCSLRPQAVILATGAAPVMPDIPNDGIPVVQALPVLLGQVVSGMKVLVVGGGLVGLETAELLIPQMRKVTIVEMLPRAGQGAGMGGMLALRALAEAGVPILVGTKVERFTKDGAICTTPEGEVSLSGFDMVIMAAGSKPYNPLQAELEGKVPALYAIGDAIQVRLAADAIREAAELAVRI